MRGASTLRFTHWTPDWIKEFLIAEESTTDSPIFPNVTLLILDCMSFDPPAELQPQGEPADWKDIVDDLQDALQRWQDGPELCGPRKRLREVRLKNALFPEGSKEAVLELGDETKVVWL